MELRLTTPRAIEFERKTGKDLLQFVQQVSDTGELKVSEAIDLFAALGENYTPELFDEWEISYADKLVAIMTAITDYVEGKK